ncbi:glycerate kinase [Chitiniphilus eburneus]|uniref:Glycerate kinase n=1 Tax=Chitiniphilus eburneus TaxID=2571148 RepID=A0A4U0Q8E2_9NEIS|nr:glycerate kinase [Chitiniphilus eburneus]TJZ77455.1 glycerate kinase [Chitiniphilus eburneus]
MKIVIAPDAYKESLDAATVAMCLRDGFAHVFPDADFVLRPIADGGEGTLAALLAASNGQRRHATVTGPLGECVGAHWGLAGDIAIIELAEAAGLALVPPALRDPTTSTTYGIGELMIAALDAGARHLLVTLGGSATCDGGAGILQALGARLLDSSDQPVGFGGAALARLARIDRAGLDPRLSGCTIEAVCDVDNPLLGPEGTAQVFAPQKGASPEQVAILDAALAHYAPILARDLRAIPLDQAGAAGGCTAALLALGATRITGAEYVLRSTGLDAEIADADLVVTGEGRMDMQTLHGKAPYAVARLAARHGKPVIGIAGSLGDGVEALAAHFQAVFPVLPRPCSREQALAEAAQNLETTARNVAAALRVGGWLGNPES